MQVAVVAKETNSLITTLLQLCNSVRQRVDNFRENRRNFAIFKDELSYAEKQLKVCYSMLKKYRAAIVSGSLENERIVLQRMLKTLRRVEESSDELEGKLKKRRRFFRDFSSANRVAGEISKHIDIVRKMSCELNEMNQNLRNFVEENDLFVPDYTSIRKARTAVYLDFSTSETMEGELKERLLQQVEHSKRQLEAGHEALVTAIVGVHGIGGVGKTTAVLGLARDADVREAFPDGIQFISVGKGAKPASLILKLRDIIRHSGGEKWSEKIDLDGFLSAAVRTTSLWFAARQVLFICDDLWQTSSSRTGYFDDLVGLLDCSPNSHMVISSQSHAVHFRIPTFVVFKPKQSTGREARGMFLTSAGMDEAMVSESDCEDLVNEVLELCGGLPLKLSIAGELVRNREDSPKMSLEQVASSFGRKRYSLLEKPCGRLSLLRSASGSRA